MTLVPIFFSTVKRIIHRNMPQKRYFTTVEKNLFFKKTKKTNYWLFKSNFYFEIPLPPSWSKKWFPPWCNNS